MCCSSVCLSLHDFLNILYSEIYCGCVPKHWFLLIEQLSGLLLDEAQVRAIIDEIKNVIIASATRKRERSERTKAEDFDADEGELLKEENEQEEEVFDQVSLPRNCLSVFSWVVSRTLSFAIYVRMLTYLFFLNFPF